jgi:hypothetical protein
VITGTELMREIEALAELEVRRAAVQRDAAALSLFVKFREHKQDRISPERLETLSKNLKSNYPLNKHFRELELAPISREFVRTHESAFETLDRMSSDAHRSRTQAAYISGVLRPFNSKYMYRWLHDRTGIDTVKIKATVENLEREVVTQEDQLAVWAENVASLFKDLVVDKSTGDGSQRTRPSGMISAKSSRIYLQSWFSFIGKHGGQILAQNGVDLDQDARRPGKLPSKRPRLSEVVINDGEQGEAPQFMNVIRDKAVSSEVANQDSDHDVASEPWRIPDVKDMVSGLTIYATLPDGTGSSCNFESSAVALPGIKMWLDTLGVLYPDESEPVGFLADLKTEVGQMRFPLPDWRISEAKEKLRYFVEKLSSSSN